MTKYVLVVAAMLVGGVSQAASISCNGSMLDYQFNVKAKTSGARVPGKAVVTALKGGKLLNKGNVPITESRFVPNASLDFTAQDSKSRVIISATYVSPGRFDGTMALSAAEGGTTVSTVCSVK